MEKLSERKNGVRKAAALGLIVCFFVVLLGKMWWKQTPSMFLFTYGILLTFIGLLTFTVTFLMYKDPYIEAQKIPASKKKNFFVSCLVAVRNEEKIIEQCIKSFIDQNYSLEKNFARLNEFLIRQVSLHGFQSVASRSMPEAKPRTKGPKPYHSSADKSLGPSGAGVSAL